MRDIHDQAQRAVGQALRYRVADGQADVGRRAAEPSLKRSADHWRGVEQRKS